MMPQPLYLDTARFGAILPACADMLREFTELLQSHGQIPQFEEFLREGSDCWPEDRRVRFPILAHWQGLSVLKDRIRQLCGVSPSATVLLSGSSSELTRIALCGLLDHAERVLCTDLDWPEFRRLLREQATRSGSVFHEITLRDQFEPGGIVANRSETIARAVQRLNCDGLLITPVSHEGIAVSIADVLNALTARVPYLVVDGSQHAGHVPIELGPGFRGVYIAGTHKWLRSGLPLYFAVMVHGEDVDSERRLLRKAIRRSAVDDMILLRTAELGLTVPQQTMRLEALLAAGLALEHVLAQDQMRVHQNRVRNGRLICRICDELPLPVRPIQSHGMVRLLGDHVEALAVQRILAGHGITVSAIGRNCVRLSCPEFPLSGEQMELLTQALEAVCSLCFVGAE